MLNWTEQKLVGIFIVISFHGQNHSANFFCVILISVFVINSSVGKKWDTSRSHVFHPKCNEQICHSSFESHDVFIWNQVEIVTIWQRGRITSCLTELRKSSNVLSYFQVWEGRAFLQKKKQTKEWNGLHTMVKSHKTDWWCTEKVNRSFFTTVTFGRVSFQNTILP